MKFSDVDLTGFKVRLADLDKPAENKIDPNELIFDKGFYEFCFDPKFQNRRKLFKFFLKHELAEAKHALRKNIEVLRPDEKVTLETDADWAGFEGLTSAELRELGELAEGWMDYLESSKALSEEQIRQFKIFRERTNLFGALADKLEGKGSFPAVLSKADDLYQSIYAANYTLISA